MTLYLSLLFVILGVFMAWKALTVVATQMAQSRLALLRNELGRCALRTGGFSNADFKEVDEVISMCVTMVSDFRINEFLIAQAQVRSEKNDVRKKPHNFSNPQMERIFCDAVGGTFCYLPLISPALLLLLAVFCTSVVLREGFGAARKSLLVIREALLTPPLRPPNDTTHRFA